MKKLISILFVFLLPFSVLANAGTWGTGIKDRDDVQIIASSNTIEVAASYGYYNNGVLTGSCSVVGQMRTYYTVHMNWRNPISASRGVIRFWRQMCN